MNESPRNRLSIGSTVTPPKVTLTITLDGERTSVTMDPDEAVLIASQLFAEASQLIPAEREFMVSPEAPARPFPSVPAPSPKMFAAPPAPTGGPAPALVEDGPEAEEIDKDAPLSVPPEYESFLAPEMSRNWRVTWSARNRGEEIDITPEQMIEAAEWPDSIEHPNESVRSHIRDGVSVLIPYADPDAIIGVTWVTRAFGDGSSSVAATKKAPSGGPGRKMPDGYSEVRRMLIAHGFEIDEHKRDHPQVSHPARPGVAISMSGSPSDYRSYRNMISRINREFGVDITQKP